MERLDIIVAIYYHNLFIQGINIYIIYNGYKGET